LSTGLTSYPAKWAKTPSKLKLTRRDGHEIIARW
jgi:hypothetical protein